MNLFAKRERSLIPVNDEAETALSKVGQGEIVRVPKFTRPRNLSFHRKWFALAKLAFDFWEPAELDDPKGLTPEKNFDRFRKDLTILAGFYEASYRIDGSVRVEAKSIAFAKMDEDEFEKLYSATIDTARKHILKNFTDEDVRNSVDEMLLEFAA